MLGRRRRRWGGKEGSTSPCGNTALPPVIWVLTSEFRVRERGKKTKRSAFGYLLVSSGEIREGPRIRQENPLFCEPGRRGQADARAHPPSLLPPEFPRHWGGSRRFPFSPPTSRSYIYIYFFYDGAKRGLSSLASCPVFAKIYQKKNPKKPTPNQTHKRTGEKKKQTTLKTATPPTGCSEKKKKKKKGLLRVCRRRTAVSPLKSGLSYSLNRRGR